MVVNVLQHQRLRRVVNMSPRLHPHLPSSGIGPTLRQVEVPWSKARTQAPARKTPTPRKTCLSMGVKSTFLYSCQALTLGNPALRPPHLPTISASSRSTPSTTSDSWQSSFSRSTRHGRQQAIVSGIEPLMDIAAARGVHSPDHHIDAYARKEGDALQRYIDRRGGVQEQGSFGGVVCGDRGGPGRRRP